ncbi:MAG: type II methionyl aminopeptidase [Candidatus Korarchaeota archaeon]|nr:type II methionyl aminopeptidase [Candidatus Korarchaeota archaeon]NIU85511.1 type II methionyl aminopeptidase [Candidatus Thorarchaeota archaeon]NIW15628.1 type II methionyl aminopeptidase [Candidatus Thorarchaeota archaeon]NIW53559.1 type II methionyl aminopeptidase [Candidatus Korarchaeota archaeon]
MKDEEKWREAGRIAAKVRTELTSMVRPGVSLLNMCEKGEQRIKELGGGPAFPINLSPNEIAAHYTSPPNGKWKAKEGVLKIDVGVQKEGFIGDTAISVPLGTPSKVMKKGLKAINEILEYTIAGIKEGVRVKTISRKIQTKAHELGFGVMKDLNGHQIKRGQLHAEITIPNVPSAFHNNKLRKGMVLAIEPFIALGRKDGKTHSRRDLLPIYSVKPDARFRSPFLSKIKRKYSSLPLAVRWLVNGWSKEEVIQNLSELATKGMVKVYPVLEETRGRLVLHKEHTVLVRSNSAEILTKP